MLIKRRIFEDLTVHLDQKEMSIIVGPRQAGKTTLMRALQDDLKMRGEKTLFLNLDIEGDRQFFQSQEMLLRKIRLEFGEEGGFVFIDEIQRKEDAGLFLKGLYDMGLPDKFIVSGSGSIELKERVHETLTGRKRIFEISTISFQEFLAYKTNYQYEDRLLEFCELEHEKTIGLMEEYLQFGGYPRVILEARKDEKNNLIEEIYRSYIERDIVYLLGAKKEEAFTHLVRILASGIGNLVNVTELSSILGIAVKTVNHYLWYLEQTFVVHKVTPYYQNVRKELTKKPRYYFFDLGLRNFAAGERTHALGARDVGFLFENFVFLLLQEHSGRRGTPIHFWRTKDRAEVDFILPIHPKPIPLEVKYKVLQSPEIERSLKNFISKYHPPRAFIVNLRLDKEIILDSTRVRFIPFSKLFSLTF